MWVFIDKRLDKYGRFRVVTVCGSIKALEKQNIVIGKRVANYRMLLRRLSKERVWSNHRYFIRECPLIREKNK